MTAIDCMVWALLGVIGGFFLGMIAAVVFMEEGRRNDGE